MRRVADNFPMSTALPLGEQAQLDRDAFWSAQAQAIHWHKPFDKVCDFSRAPFVYWFCHGRTNLCHNAIDRHLPLRADQKAIVFLSTETEEQRTLTYRELHREVNRMAATLRELGVEKGDRVVIYLPMVPEAAISMLACVRLGAVHSAVFAGYAAESLAQRIEDAGARLVITCDASLRGGKLIRLKQTVDEALEKTGSPVRTLVVQRGLDPQATLRPGRDFDYATLAARHANAEVPCEWLESHEPSYILYTSGTTAKPKGIQRDTGGYSVALAASMQHIFGSTPGETFFSTADVGWVVGHSYTVYGPLIHGMTTVIFEGLPTHHGSAIWWEIAQQTKASTMFSSPTAIRILKKSGDDVIRRHDLGGLRRLFLAGEPLDEPTSTWINQALGHVQIIDNYWQTESGWPILAKNAAAPGRESKPGSPGFPVYGYDAYIADETTGAPLPRGEKGILSIRLPLPPGCLTTVWKNDPLFVNHYCGQFPGMQVYSTFDYAVQDTDGYFFILGRTDDVINVAGHRIGTREIEEVLSSDPAVAEAAAVGATDAIKGQTIKCWVVLREPAKYPTPESLAAVIAQIENTLVTKLGSLARPSFIGVVRQLPKTRSGKILRRSILALAENRDPGDLSTLDDPSALDGIRESLSSPSKSPTP